MTFFSFFLPFRLFSNLSPGRRIAFHLLTTHEHNTILLCNLSQTNATNGFRVEFQDLYLYYGAKVQIGTGNDPSDIQSGITTIHGYISYAPDDVYADTNEMWLAVIGANGNSGLRMVVEIISIDLSSEF